MELNQFKVVTYRYSNSNFQSATLIFKHPSGAVAGQIDLRDKQAIYDLEYIVQHLKREMEDRHDR